MTTAIAARPRVRNIYFLGNLTLTPTQQQRLLNLGAEGVHCFAQPEDAITLGITTDDYVLVNNLDLNALLPALAPARLVVHAATGYGMLDLDAVTRYDVRLTNLPDYSTGAVTEYLLWGALHALGRRGAAAARVPAGRWNKDGLYGRELGGRTAGFVGLGRIGTHAALAFRALGMEVMGAGRYPDRANTIPTLPLDELAAWSEVLCVTCREEPGTRGLLNAEIIRRFRPDVTLVTISANAVLDLEALAAFFTAHPDASAVLDLDPLPESHPLLGLPNVTITPHTAFASEETLARRIDACLDLVEADVQGRHVPLLPGNDVRSNRAVRDDAGVTLHQTATRHDADDLLQLAQAFRISQAVGAALSLGVFDAAREPRTAAELAQAVDAPETALTLLLHALVGQGLLRGEADGRFRNSELATRRLARGPESYRDVLLAALADGYAAWSTLADAVRAGGRNSTVTDPEPAFHAAEAHWQAAWPLIRPWLPERPVNILELGGGPATLTRALLHAHPRATAVCIDTPQGLDHCARNYLEAEGLTRRCTLSPVDRFSEAALTGRFDLVLLAEGLRGRSAEEATALLNTAAGAVAPGGTLCALGHFLDARRHTPAAASLDALDNLLHGTAHPALTAQDAVHALQAGGLDNLHLHHLSQLLRLIRGRRKPC